MASTAQGIPQRTSTLDWFGDFLREELSPYPGRGILVTRMVVAAAIVMLIDMTFRIPYQAYAVLYTLTISRENPHATIKQVKTIIAAFGFSAAYVLLSAHVFLYDPLLRPFWVIATLFLIFFALKALANYTAAARLGYMLVITIPLWDELTTAQARVEGTLWAVFAISIGAIVTVAVEVVFSELKPHNHLIESISRRLTAIERLLNCYVDARPVDHGTENEISHLVMTGTSRMRRDLQRSGYSPLYAEQMGAVVVLSGRLVDTASLLTRLALDISEHDRQRLKELAQSIAGVRENLLSGKVPRPPEFDGNLSPQLPLLREMETTVSLIGKAFVGTDSLQAYAPEPSSHEPRTAFFARDAFSNLEYVKFALRGCFAASLCYLIYNGKDWPGISTSVTTCFVTALSTVGSSHQKQILRVAGALVGGLILGMGSQIFVLPYIDSISGFTLLFLAVTILTAWITTSGPRLSYAGVQIAISFYLINLSEFRVQTSLEPARDRVVGVLLGSTMMWLVFDRLWTVPTIVEMKRVFVTNVRLLARFVREPSSSDLHTAITQSFTMRESINKNLDTVRSLGDSVLLEFGPTRQKDLESRGRILDRQTQLRMLFLTKIALWKYRAGLPGFELPEAVRLLQKEFEEELARTLEYMADQLDEKASPTPQTVEVLLEKLEENARSPVPEHERAPDPASMPTFLSLCRTAATITVSLWQKRSSATES